MDEEGSVQNVAAFREEHEKMLEHEKSRREAQTMTNASEKGVDGKDVKSKEEATEAVTEKLATKTLWYEILVSRRMSKGALAVKLVRARMDASQGVSPRSAVDTEEEAFWLSGLKPASQENADMLDKVA